jgi:thiamine-phosphate pyrophosphorylase
MAEGMNGPLLRLLDANSNRAREALRVVEDYARFVLDDAGLSSDLKDLRHELTEVTRAWSGEAILWRDTPGDVGTAHKTQAELQRHDLADVLIAAGKRLGEALRAIEEYLKITSPADAAKVEAARYRFYDLEQRIARTLRPAERFAHVRLYVLITESACRLPWFEVAERALLGGADCLQLREKDLNSGEILARARLLSELCHRHNALCIINDRPDIALLSGADGVHVGQEDLPATEARKIIGSRRLVGVSTHNLEQARAAHGGGADYVGIGPCFVSGTKPRDFVAGLNTVREVARSAPIPAVAIAGITAANVDEVMQAGVSGVAVTAAVCAAEDPRKAAAELRARLVGQSTCSKTP